MLAQLCFIARQVGLTTAVRIESDFSVNKKIR
jgi:hypothetical protein